MDGIDREVSDLIQRFAHEAEEAKLVQLIARRERREALREKLRAGGVPDHFKGCSQCMRAVLTLDKDAACAEGKGFTNLW